MEHQSEIEREHYFKEIWNKFKLPWKPFNVAFWGYLIGVIIIYGGIGIGFTIYDVYNSPQTDGHLIAQGIATYFIALLASAFIDLNLLPDIQNRISNSIFSSLFFGVGFFLLWLSYHFNNYIAFIPAFAGFFFSIFIWIISNADSEKFNENTYNEKIRKEAKEKHGAKWNNQ